MAFGKEMIQYNDELYWVYRKVRAEVVKDADTIKKHWHCDVALRTGELIFFCRHIPNAKIVEE
jgi:hypothetical protein